MKKIIFALLVLLVPAISYGDEFKVNKMLDGFVRVNRASGSVIRSWEDDGGKYWTYVLTANHVVDTLKDQPVPGEFPVYNNRGQEIDTFLKDGVIVSSNFIFDYAIVAYETDKLWSVIDTIDIEQASNFGIFDEVYAVGQPNSQKTWASKGIISSFAAPYIGHDAKIFYGSSGGPLFNDDYEQIAINTNVSGFYLDGDKKLMMPIPHIGFTIPLSVIYTSLGPEQTKTFFGK